jgi:hypothetical protein
MNRWHEWTYDEILEWNDYNERHEHMHEMNDMTWHEMTWHEMIWHEMTWHDMKWHVMNAWIKGKFSDNDIKPNELNECMN